MAAGNEFDVAEFSSSECHLALRRSPVPVRRHPGVRPSLAYSGTASFSSTASTSRRRRTSEGKRIGVPVYTHDGGNLHQRGLLSDGSTASISQRAMGRRRHQRAPRHGNPTIPADGEEAFDPKAPTGRASRSAPCWRTANCRRSSAPVCPEAFGRYPDVVRLLSDLPLSREGLLPAHQDFPPDHAHGGDPPRRSMRKHPFLASDQPVPRLR